MARTTVSQRNFDRYTAFRMRQADIYRKHIQYKSTHAAILADLTRSIYDDPQYAKLPQIYRFALSEISGQWLSRIHELHLVWQLGPESGPIRSAGDEWTPEMSELSRTPGALFGSHYWKDSDRLFGEWKAIN